MARCSSRCSAKSRSCCFTHLPNEVAMFKSRQRPIGDWRLARAARPWSSFMDVGDQGQWAARFEHVIDRFGDPLTVGPVEGLAKGDQPEPSETERGDVLGQGLHPADVADT